MGSKISLLSLASILIACSVEPPVAAEAARGERTTPVEPRLSEALFFARIPGQAAELELSLALFRAEVTPRIAATVTHAVVEIRNPADFPVEAVIRLPLPPGAAITRGVLHVGSNPMEGVFVERVRAQQIYDQIVSGSRDPMLIVWRDPELIDVSIFPLAAHEKRRFELEWVEPNALTPNGSIYRVPVIAHRGRAIAKPELSVSGAPIEPSERSSIETNVGPADLATARLPGDPFGLVLARGTSSAQPPAVRVMIAADTSADMSAADRKEQRAIIRRVIEELPAEARTSLIAMDWGTDLLAQDAAKPDALAALDELDARPSAGAIDVEHGLSAAIDAAARSGATNVLFIGHGRDQFVYRDALAEPLDRLRAAKASLFFIGLTESRQAISDAAWISGGRTGVAIDLPLILRDIAAASKPQPPDLGGIDTWYPLQTVAGEVVWVGRFVGGGYPGAVRADARDLEALWARAKIRPHRGERDPGEQHRVLTPLTSILALESEAEHARWGIGSVSSVFGPGGLGTSINSAMGGLRGVSLGIGGLGVRGSGSGTGGYGNIDLGGRGKSTTRLVPGRTIIRGSLSRDQIGRVIRRNLARFKYCYEKQLLAIPSLAGTVRVQFTIAPSGAVAQASIRDTTMYEQNVESCVVTVVRSLKFPAPAPRGAGIVLVTYPLVFGTDEQFSASDQGWIDARALIRGGDSNPKQIAALVGAPTHLEREALAWWLVENRLRRGFEPIAAAQVVAELLVESEQSDAAERILSERALEADRLVEAELLRFGAPKAAERIARLALIPMP